MTDVKSLQVKRVNPIDIHASLKEAVADSLLNVTYARISGGGHFGHVLYGGKPRRLLSSGFLLPAAETIGDADEVTSPIHISSHGLDFQISKSGKGRIAVKPNLSLYVRLLPNEDDLKRFECQVRFILTLEKQRELRELAWQLERERWEIEKSRYPDKRRHPEWQKIVDELRRKACQTLGLPILSGEAVPGQVDEKSSADGSLNENVAAIATLPGVGGIDMKDEHYREEKLPHKWLRLDVDLPALEFDPYSPSEERASAIAASEEAMRAAIEARLHGWAEDSDPHTGGKLWAFRRGLKLRPSHLRDWNKFLNDVRQNNVQIALPKGLIDPTDRSIRWDIEVTDDWLNPDRFNVHVALENKAKDDSRSDESDGAIFLVALSTNLPIDTHRFLKLERVKPSYRYNRYLKYAAIGLNCGVAHSDKDETRTLTTTWTPRYIQPRIAPRPDSEVLLNIRTLSKPESIKRLRPLVNEFRQWLKEVQSNTDVATGIDTDEIDARGREEKAFRNDVKKWEEEIAAIDSGVAILEDSARYWKVEGPQSDRRAIPFEAWLSMNEAMANVAGNRYDDWRLFQMAFILANVPTLATRLPEYADQFNPERDDAVTLLYFATGGGKSEAFFGLLTLNLFFDRLRGKHRGVTAMIRYPLRLLTIQQAQRASRVLAQAEIVRRRRRHPDRPFEIGFWVGSGGTPNNLATPGVSDIPFHDEVKIDETSLREGDAKYRIANKAWNKIPVCPFCSGITGLRRFKAQGNLLAHVCLDTKCNANEGALRPLPFYIVDEDIYDIAPSVLLGTVDKLALIGHSHGTIRRILGMFGAAPWLEKTTDRLHLPLTKEELRKGPGDRFTTVYPSYKDGQKVFFDPFPSLLIQDEAHLLDESLGTFSGLFETILSAIFDEMTEVLGDLVVREPGSERRRKTKVIAASATVADPERQMQHLYQRGALQQFPHPGPEFYWSFYAVPVAPDPQEKERFALPIKDVEVRTKQARIYTAFMTNGRPHTATSVAILSSFHLTTTDLFDGLISGDDARQSEVREKLCRHLSPGLLQSIFRDRIMAAQISDLATIVDLHRIALTYVTNKKGGDQIMAAESEEVRKKHAMAGLSIDGFITKLITGSVDQGEIQAVVADAQRRANVGEPFKPLSSVLRSIVATSAVSHGVDVEELNSMFFAGMPSDIAEYIQASSRVGRTHVGFCVLIPTPQRKRDRYIVEVFDIFHRFLERMIQPAAIDRWAEKAVRRTLPSFFQAFMCGVLGSKTFIDAPEDKKPLGNENVSDVTLPFRSRPVEFVRAINKFIGHGIGLDTAFRPPRHAVEHYENMIATELRALLARMDRRDFESSSLSGYFKSEQTSFNKPMTSLRDVDQAGWIQLSRRHMNKSIDAGKVKDAMEFIRHGGGNEDLAVDKDQG